ncbi:radical S-adenosyl methionine domain-containing protein 1, mitochondrial-like isoform X2 [Gigantopelta aegis]|uniref:radical S-adenosyl methionine domain-containing protein 1, mitochondrial-like isoform X2 n=1 Tax=Gigantopelta aegis TaxID=1735272 RepID=UPI001B88C413|nr:radical S-adenosyl methionine domain-containing protein 1, mitochondrial-like isoform X2 [Gigantopelta aegis]
MCIGHIVRGGVVIVISTNILRTPSLAEPETIYSVINTVKEMVKFSNQGEVTLEVNPTILEKAHLRDFKSAGINRVSVGVQTLDSNALAVLGRDHTVKSALECVHDARVLFPGSVSVDLIFGFPGHSLSAWKRELQQLLQICDKHISLYQLTLERGTQLFKMIEKGLTKLPPEDEIVDMYKTAVQVLKENGFERYEVSNFAKEVRYSTHNLAYWEGKQYIGVGPGAHGRFVVQSNDGSLERHARIQTLEPDNWMWEIERFNHATRKIVKQTKIDILEELLALGMRICWGISHQRWNQRCPQLSLYDIFNSDIVSTYCSANLLKLDNRGLRATPEGMDVLDSIIPDLILLLHQARAR